MRRRTSSRSKGGGDTLTNFREGELSQFTCSFSSVTRWAFSRRRRVSSRALPDCFRKLVGIDRFDQIILDAESKGFDGDLLGTMCGKENGWNKDHFLVEFAEQIEPGGVGKLEVEQEQSGFNLSDRIQRAGTV